MKHYKNRNMQIQRKKMRMRTKYRTSDREHIKKKRQRTIDKHTDEET